MLIVLPPTLCIGNGGVNDSEGTGFIFIGYVQREGFERCAGCVWPSSTSYVSRKPLLAYRSKIKASYLGGSQATGELIEEAEGLPRLRALRDSHQVRTATKREDPPMMIVVMTSADGVVITCG